MCMEDASVKYLIRVGRKTLSVKIKGYVRLAGGVVRRTACQYRSYEKNRRHCYYPIHPSSLPVHFLILLFSIYATHSINPFSHDFSSPSAASGYSFTRYIAFESDISSISRIVDHCNVAACLFILFVCGQARKRMVSFLRKEMQTQDAPPVDHAQGCVMIYIKQNQVMDIYSFIFCGSACVWEQARSEKGRLIGVRAT